MGRFVKAGDNRQPLVCDIKVAYCEPQNHFCTFILYVSIVVLHHFIPCAFLLCPVMNGLPALINAKIIVLTY